MQELDEEIKLHNAGGDDAPDTSDVSAGFLGWKKLNFFSFAADQQLDGEDA